MTAAGRPLHCRPMNPAKRKLKLDEARQAATGGSAEGTAAAERILQALLRDNRADTQALHMLGVIAASRQDDAAAAAHLARCALLDPRNAQFHNDLARVHALAGRHGAALQSLQQAVALQPGNRRALTDLADVLERSGQPDRAADVLAPLLKPAAADDDVALVQMRLLARRGQAEPAIAVARARLAQAAPLDTTRRQLLQLMGRQLEATGDFSGAFQAWTEAKRDAGPPFDPFGYIRQIDDLIKVYSKAALDRLPRSTDATALPVFIASMPRAGSTLVEQVLHAHPQAHGAGESPLLHQAVTRLPALLGGGLPYPHCTSALDAAAVQRMARAQLDAMAALAPGALRISNKHLLNPLHLGLVSRLFPGARVVHVRRHPMDNGLACYMASLSPALLPWANDLADIGLAWRQTERLMAHWRDTLDLQWLDVQYEDLVQDSEAQIRRLIDFCGLDWDARCLRYWEADRVVLTPSYDQVRQPIFRTAVDRWQKYGSLLDPLRQALDGLV